MIARFCTAALMFFLFVPQAAAGCNEEALVEVTRLADISLAGDEERSEGRFELAEKLYRETIEAQEPGQDVRIVALHRLADLYLAQRRGESAVKLSEQATAELVQTYGKSHLYSALIRTTEISALAMSGKQEAANIMHQLAEQLYNKTTTPWSHDESGGAIHTLSDIGVPLAAGELRRGEISTLNPFCTEVAALYHAPDMFLSLFLTRLEEAVALNELFRQSSAYIQHTFPEVSLLGEGPLESVAPNMPNNGRVAVFSVPNPETGSKSHSLLYMLKAGNWLVKVEFTYAVQEEPSANAAVQSLWKGMHWPVPK